MVDDANASAIVMSLIAATKSNNLNIYQYLYTLLLHVPDYKYEPAGIILLMRGANSERKNVQE